MGGDGLNFIGVALDEGISEEDDFRSFGGVVSTCRLQAVGTGREVRDAPLMGVVRSGRRRYWAR